jgi:hypothetical protein
LFVQRVCKNQPSRTTFTPRSFTDNEDFPLEDWRYLVAQCQSLGWLRKLKSTTQCSSRSEEASHVLREWWVVESDYFVLTKIVTTSRNLLVIQEEVSEDVKLLFLYRESSSVSAMKSDKFRRKGQKAVTVDSFQWDIQTWTSRRETLSFTRRRESQNLFTWRLDNAN